MSVSIKNGIGFSNRTGAVYIDMAAVPGSKTGKLQQPVRPVIIENTNKSVPWALWGDNNQLPYEMLADIEGTGILNGIIDGKARFAVCNGLLPALVHYEKNGAMVIDDIVMAPEIQDFLDDNNHFFHTYGWMKDLCGFNNGVARIMLNGERNKVALFQRDDVTELRYEKMDAAGVSNNIYLSAHWDKVKNEQDNRVVKVPLLNANTPLLDLQQRAAKGGAEFAITFKNPGWGKKYYSLALWYAALKWVKIAQGVPEMKAAMFENNFRPKFMVIISEKYWEKVFLTTDGKSWDDYTQKEIEDKKNKVYDDIDNNLAGSENAYKTVFVDGYIDPTTGKLIPEIEIRPIDDTTKNGEFLPDSAAANSEIAFATLFNPAIIGANMPSGPYTNSQGGSNVRESTLIQVIIHELERRHIRHVFNIISRFNGWNKTYVPDTNKQKLEFIIPATIPTTLDTGSNVKPMVTGASPAPGNTAAA